MFNNFARVTGFTIYILPYRLCVNLKLNQDNVNVNCSHKAYFHHILFQIESRKVDKSAYEFTSGDVKQKHYQVPSIVESTKAFFLYAVNWVLLGEILTTGNKLKS